jgi:hypothetical protein
MQVRVDQQRLKNARNERREEILKKLLADIREHKRKEYEQGHAHSPDHDDPRDHWGHLHDDRRRALITEAWPAYVAKKKAEAQEAAARGEVVVVPPDELTEADFEKPR